MTPKDKAKELIERMHKEQEGYYLDNINNAKQCALIAVDELIKQCWEHREIDLEESCDYWKQVKNEIEKL